MTEKDELAQEVERRVETLVEALEQTVRSDLLRRWEIGCHDETLAEGHDLLERLLSAVSALGKTNPLLHLHGQMEPGDEAYIVGNPDGLRRFALALLQVLYSGKPTGLKMYCGDDQPYHLHIMPWTGPWDVLALPYTFVPDERPGVLWPWEGRIK